MQLAGCAPALGRSEDDGNRPLINRLKTVHPTKKKEKKSKGKGGRWLQRHSSSSSSVWRQHCFIGLRLSRRQTNWAKFRTWLSWLLVCRLLNRSPALYLTSPLRCLECCSKEESKWHVNGATKFLRGAWNFYRLHVGEFIILIAQCNAHAQYKITKC